MDVAGMLFPVKSWGNVGTVWISFRTPFGRVEIEGGHGVLQLIDDVHKLAVRVDVEVAGPGAGIDLHVRRLVGGERSLGRVQAVDGNLVVAAIGHDGEPAIGGDSDRMWVRPAL